MNKTNIERLPEAVRNKSLAKSKAVQIIWEELYTRPYLYGLHLLNEDQLSEFLLKILPKFEGMIEKFRPGSASFRQFISNYLLHYKHTFLRKQREEYTDLKSSTTQLLTTFEEESQKYILAVAEPSPMEKQQQPRSFKDIVSKDTKSFEENQRRIAEITALILAMKACNDIDDDMIRTVSDFTGLDRKILHGKIEELRESTKKKTTQCGTLIRRRNNAFFFHRKYREEMLAPTTTKNQKEKLQRRFDTQTKRWQKRNEQLSLCSKTPSNEEIAKIVGIKTRTVSFYINHVKNPDTQRRFHQCYEESEKHTRLSAPLHVASDDGSFGRREAGDSV